MPDNQLPPTLTIERIKPKVCQYTNQWAVKGEADRYLSRISGTWELWGTHLKREDFWWPDIEDVLEFCYLKADLPEIDGKQPAIIRVGRSYRVRATIGAKALCGKEWCYQECSSWPTAREAYLAAQAAARAAGEPYIPEWAVGVPVSQHRPLRDMRAPAARPAGQCPLDGIDAPPLPRAEAEAIVDRIIKEAVLESRPTDPKGEGLESRFREIYEAHLRSCGAANNIKFFVDAAVASLHRAQPSDGERHQEGDPLAAAQKIIDTALSLDPDFLRLTECVRLWKQKESDLKQQAAQLRERAERAEGERDRLLRGHFREQELEAVVPKSTLAIIALEKEAAEVERDNAKSKLTALEAEIVRLRSLLLGCRNAWVRDASEGDGIRDEDSLLLQCVDAALTPTPAESGGS